MDPRQHPLPDGPALPVGSQGGTADRNGPSPRDHLAGGPFGDLGGADRDDLAGWYVTPGGDDGAPGGGGWAGSGAYSAIEQNYIGDRSAPSGSADRFGQAGHIAGAHGDDDRHLGQFGSSQFGSGQYGDGSYGDGQYDVDQYDVDQYDNGQYDNGQYDNGRYGDGRYEVGQFGSDGYGVQHFANDQYGLDRLGDEPHEQNPGAWYGAATGGGFDGDAWGGAGGPAGAISPEERERYGLGHEDDDDIDLGSSATRNLLEWAVVLVGAVLVALLLRAALFQAFWIPSESMEHTLEIRDRVLVNKLSYRLHDINRGDVVVFVRPDDQPAEIRDLIKRVIGLPGETIEGRNNAVYVNGNRLEEPYLEEGVPIENFGPIVVPADEIFVMGDNRDESYDSRRFGTVPEERVVGRAFVLFWPLDRVAWL